MKRNGFKIALFLVVVITLLFTGCTPQKEFVNITTGGTGGTYYPVGGALADLLTKNLENVNVTAQAGNASVANCNLINNNETETAFVQNNVAYWAYKGIGSFEGSAITKLNGIATLYPEAIQIVALKESGINSINDLVGKKVAVGEQGSGVDFDAKKILAVHDITYDDIVVDYLSFSEAAQKLKDKQIDAAFVTAGFPTSSIIDVSLSRDIVLVPIEENKIKQLIDVSPYYAKAVIPANTYEGQNDDIVTATTMAMWVVSEEVSEDLVYNMTKVLWENFADLAAVHEKGKDITLETALDGMAIPLHPGAEKYYKEVGLVK